MDKKNLKQLWILSLSFIFIFFLILAFQGLHNKLEIEDELLHSNNFFGPINNFIIYEDEANPIKEISAIEIIEARHLDINKNFISNIYDAVRKQDNLWSEPIYDGEYVRVIFEKSLTSKGDITIYAKSDSEASVEVYEKDGPDVLMTFEDIHERALHKLYLDNLEGEQDTFDLKILGAPVQFDWITDPWANATFGRCRNITIGNAGSSTLTNFPAYINLTYDSDMQADYSDIRFYNASCGNDGSLMDYEIENYTASNAHIWARIPTLPAAGTVISVYYKNSTAVSSGENATGVWDDNYVMVQHMEEGSGNIIDSTSNDNDADVIDGTPAYLAEGQMGDAIEFDGSTDSFEIPNSASLDITGTAITFSAWIKTSDQTDYPVVMNKGAGDERYVLFIWTAAGPTEGVQYGMTARVQAGGDVVSNTDVTDNAWHYIAGAYDGVNLIIYVDGENDNSISETASLTTSSGKLTIGSYNTDVALPFTGTIDEVRVSDTVKTPDWINQSYQMVANQGTYVTFGDEESGNAAPDTPILNSPVNNSNISVDYAMLNATVTDADGDNMTVWFYGDGSLINTTENVVNGTAVTYNWTGLSDGGHNWSVIAGDGTENTTSDTYYFSVDATAPNVQFVPPTTSSGTQSNSDIFANVTASDTNLQTIVIYLYNSTDLVNSTNSSTGAINKEINFTSLADETYYLNASANDTLGNINWTETRTITISEVTPDFAPNVSLIRPANDNLTYNGTIDFSCNASDDFKLRNISLYVWNLTGELNYTNTISVNGTFNQTSWNVTFEIGNYSWNCLAYDNLSNGSWAASNFSFEILEDTIPPKINITYPQNITYGTNVSELNYSYTESNPDRCWYSNDSGITNSTPVAMGTNFTSVISIEGTNNWTLYCNDTYGNENITSVVFFKDFCPDGMSGYGNLSDPCQITNCTQLQSMEGKLDASYEIISNINCSDTINWNSGKGFDPIGWWDGGAIEYPFKGSLEGNEYNITDVYINRPDSGAGGVTIGMIGFISGGEISNVRMKNVNITGRFIVGGMVGSNGDFSNITNCSSTGFVNGTYFHIGGLVGWNGRNATIRNSWSSVNVFASGADAGGLVGSNYEDCLIIDSYATGNITSSVNYAGGLLGLCYGSVMNSYATGNVIGDTRVGGVSGHLATGNISNSFATGNVTGNSNKGGLLGDYINGSIINSYWNNHTGNPQNCYWEGDSGCTAVQNDEAYFKGDVYPDNEPMASWSFFDIWEERRNDYPSLTWQNLGGNISRPNAPNVTLESIDGTNSSEVDLNCSSNMTDFDGDNMNVSVKWYKNNTLNRTINYNNSYPDGSVFSAILSSGNLTPGDVWKCSVGLYDGSDYSNFANSSNVSILDTTPPSITINSPSLIQNVSKFQVLLNLSFSEKSEILYDLDEAGNTTLCCPCTEEVATLNFTYYGNHSIILYVNDSSNNRNITIFNFTLNLDTDLDGLADFDDNDDDNDGLNDSDDFLNGNLSNINTNILNLNLTVGNSTNLSQQFTGPLLVNFTNNTCPILHFNYNFSANDTLVLGEIIVEKQNSSAVLGSIFIKNINLSAGQTKIVYIDDLDSDKNSVCIEDSEITSIADVSLLCSGSGEVKVRCDGSVQSGFTCDDLGIKYKITGLENSGIIEVSDAVVPSVGVGAVVGDGFGVGGGCVAETWECEEWSECILGSQERNCTSNCGTKRIESRECVVEIEEKPMKILDTNIPVFSVLFSGAILLIFVVIFLMLRGYWKRDRYRWIKRR